MRGDEQLRAPADGQIVQDPQERELARGRQRRLRLVEQINPVLESILKQRQERLAVRLLVARP